MSKTWTVKEDKAFDKKKGIKEGSKKDMKPDKAHGVYEAEMRMKKAKAKKKKK